MYEFFFSVLGNFARSLSRTICSSHEIQGENIVFEADLTHQLK